MLLLSRALKTENTEKRMRSGFFFIYLALQVKIAS